MAQASKQYPWSLGAVISLLICLLIAGGSRMSRLDNPLTADEVWMLAGSAGHGRDISMLWKHDSVQITASSPTALTTARPVREIWSNSVPSHPPLHSIFLRLWRELIGASDVKARAFSMAWSLLTIVMVFAALRLQFSSIVATCSALVLALSPLQSDLSTEVRSYSMVIAFMSIAAWLMVRIETLGVTRWQVWSLGLLCLPMMLSHYFAAGPCLAILIWGLWRLRGRMRINFLMAVAVAAVLFLILWLPFALRDVPLLDANQFLTSYDPSKRFLAIASLPERLLISGEGVPALRTGSIAMLALVLTAWHDRRLLIWSLFLFVPLLSILCLDFWQGTETISWARYCSFMSLGIAVGPLAAAFAVNRRFGIILAISIILAILPYSNLERDLGSLRHDHMMSTFAPIVLKRPQGLPLVSTNGSQSSSWHPSFMHWSQVPGFVPRPTLVLSDRPDPAVLAKLKTVSSDGRFWVTSYGLDPIAKGEQSMPQWLRQRFPGAHLLEGPWLLNRGEGKVSERLPMSLWLMQFDRSPG